MDTLQARAKIANALRSFTRTLENSFGMNRKVKRFPSVHRFGATFSYAIILKAKNKRLVKNEKKNVETEVGSSDTYLAK